MKNILFIVSHLESGYECLINSLNTNERIDIKHLQLTYSHPEILDYLFSHGHKLNNSACFYGDLILFNKNFSSKSLYNFSKFVFLIRSPFFVLNKLVESKKFTELTAYRYYSFRLRRMYEMARHSNKYFFLTYEDLNNQQIYSKLLKSFKIKGSVQMQSLEKIFVNNSISVDLMKKANDTYEKYLYLFKNINQ